MMRLSTSSLLLKTVCLGAAVALAASVHAQPGKPQDLFVVPDGTRFAVSTGSVNERVGSAVMLRVLVLLNTGKGASSRHLMACDGSWMSSRIDMQLADHANSFADLEAKTLQRERAVPLEPILFQPAIGDISDALRPRIAQLCATAMPERRATFVPIVDGETKGQYWSDAIVVGTAQRNNTFIELWLRETPFERELERKTDRTPLTIKGEDVYTRKLKAGKTMKHVIVDCSKRRLGLLRSVSYKGDDTLASDFTYPPEESPFQHAVPESKGERTLNAVCTLYGKPESAG